MSHISPGGGAKPGAAGGQGAPRRRRPLDDGLTFKGASSLSPQGLWRGVALAASALTLPRSSAWGIPSRWSDGTVFRCALSCITSRSSLRCSPRQRQNATLRLSAAGLEANAPLSLEDGHFWAALSRRARLWRDFGRSSCFWLLAELQPARQLGTRTQGLRVGLGFSRNRPGAAWPGSSDRRQEQAPCRVRDRTLDLGALKPNHRGPGLAAFPTELLPVWRPTMTESFRPPLAFIGLGALGAPNGKPNLLAAGAFPLSVPKPGHVSREAKRCWLPVLRRRPRPQQLQPPPTGSC